MVSIATPTIRRRSNDLPARVLDGLLRRRQLVLLGWLALWVALHWSGTGAGWHYFVTGAHVLFSGNALDLYATHSELQIGPLTLVAVAPFALLLHGAIGKGLALVLMSALGLVMLDQIRRLVPGQAQNAQQQLLIALLVIPVWVELSVHWMHPDDVMALLFGVVALRMVQAQRWVAAAVLVGAAVDSKPWAIAFVPMVLLLPRRRLAAVLTSGLTIALAWLPFYLANPHATLGAAKFKIAVSSASVIHLLGVHATGTPSWCRPAQFALGLGLAVFAAYRRRPGAILLLALCARLLLDPATKTYYDAGLIVAAAVFDVMVLGGIVPWLTVLAFVLFYLPGIALTTEPDLRAALRAVFLLGAAAAAIALPTRAVAGAGRSPAAAGRPVIKRLLVLIPTYNEAVNLPLILDRLHRAVPHADALVIDDASPDGTGRIADDLAAVDGRIHVVHRGGKAGLGSAYLAGFQWALDNDYDAIVEMDADGSHAPEELPMLIGALGEADLAMGSRWIPGGMVENWPRRREWLSRAGNRYARSMIGVELHDLTGGYRAYRRSALQGIDLAGVRSEGYCFQVELAWKALRAGCVVTEVPITFVERTHGESKMAGGIVLEALLRVTHWAARDRLARLRGTRALQLS
jgi:dolichol-phosphate mannosyltransferase